MERAKSLLLPYLKMAGHKYPGGTKNAIQEMVKEYNLIQKKSSRLSRRQRDWVELEVNAMLQKGIVEKVDGVVIIKQQ